MEFVAAMVAHLGSWAIVEWVPKSNPQVRRPSRRATHSDMVF